MRRVEASFYVQFKADRTYWDKKVAGMRAVKLTQNKPAVVEQDCVVVKFRAALSDEAFENLPIVAVEVPLSDVAGATAESVPA